MSYVYAMKKNVNEKEIALDLIDDQLTAQLIWKLTKEMFFLPDKNSI